MKKSKKWSLIAGTFVVLAVAAAWGFSTLRGASSALDPSRLATVERATMTRSVVATGKVEPITKVEIKSKANGIIERLFVDVDQVVMPGQVLAELDKENLTARVREARANLQAAEAARAAAAAQLKKNEVEADYRELIASLTPDLAQFEKIKRIVLLAREFSLEAGELTPTLKVKRRVVENKYKDLIDRLYEGSAA